MQRFDKTEKLLIFSLPVLIALGLAIPDWIQFLLHVSLANGLVSLGVLLQMRLGLVSFGQGLFFCIGGYAAGTAGHLFGVSDVLVLLVLGVIVSVLLSIGLGALLSRYREIFYAMLTLALSMILFGLLVKAESLGSTDGFNLPSPTYFGWAPTGKAAGHAGFITACLVSVVAAAFLHRYLRGPMGLIGEALRENELRLEYLGTSARRAVHITYVIAAAVSGLGGVLAAIAVGHVDPEMTYWTTSGNFVFITLLSGPGSVIAPFIGAFVLEIVRIYAVELSPNTWQIILGTAMLVTIIFLPNGLWSLATSLKRKFAS